MAQPRHIRQKAEAVMNDDVKNTIDQLANSLQTVTLLSTRLRRDLGESAQQAVDLEAAADNAVRAIKRLQPPDKKTQ
jgi:hypothetical protein